MNIININDVVGIVSGNSDRVVTAHCCGAERMDGIGGGGVVVIIVESTVVIDDVMDFQLFLWRHDS